MAVLIPLGLPLAFLPSSSHCWRVINLSGLRGLPLPLFLGSSSTEQSVIPLGAFKSFISESYQYLAKNTKKYNLLIKRLFCRFFEIGLLQIWVGTIIITACQLPSPLLIHSPLTYPQVIHRLQADLSTDLSTVLITCWG